MERATARIDFGAVQRNCARLKEELGRGVELCAVVKADGYGHGATLCADAAVEGGATRLAVATAAEAEQIGRALPAHPAADDGSADAGGARRRARRGLGDRRLARRIPRSRRRTGARPGPAGPRPRQARQRHGPARQPRPGEGDRDRPRLRGEPEPRAGRHLDPLRDRRRTGLRLLRRAARALLGGRRGGPGRVPRRDRPRRQQRRRPPRPPLAFRHGPLRGRDLRSRSVPARPRRARPHAGPLAALLRRRRQALRRRRQCRLRPDLAGAADRHRGRRCCRSAMATASAAASRNNAEVLVRRPSPSRWSGPSRWTTSRSTSAPRPMSSRATRRC